MHDFRFHASTSGNVLHDLRNACFVSIQLVAPSVALLMHTTLLQHACVTICPSLLLLHAVLSFYDASGSAALFSIAAVAACFVNSWLH